MRCIVKRPALHKSSRDLKQKDITIHYLNRKVAGLQNIRSTISNRS